MKSHNSIVAKRGEYRERERRIEGKVGEALREHSR
jgi:hypothetical protein